MIALSGLRLCTALVWTAWYRMLQPEYISVCPQCDHGMYVPDSCECVVCAAGGWGVICRLLHTGRWRSGVFHCYSKFEHSQNSDCDGVCSTSPPCSTSTLESLSSQYATQAWDWDSTYLLPRIDGVVDKDWLEVVPSGQEDSMTLDCLGLLWISSYMSAW